MRTQQTPERESIEPHALRWHAFLAALMIFTMGSIGYGVDRLQNLTSAPLFTALMLSSLMGTMLAGLYVRSTANRPWKLLLLLLALYAIWRVLYYPWLLLAQTAAGWLEWICTDVLQVGGFIYPSLLVLVAILHLGSGMLCGALLSRRAVWWSPLWLVLLLLGTAISFSSRADWSLLPDYGLWSRQAAVAPALRGSDPYLEPAPGPARSRNYVEALCYRTSSDGPWSSTVQGTLAKLVRSDSERGTLGRIEQLYLALRAAHRFVGSRAIEVRRSTGSATTLAAAEGLR